VPRQSLDWSGLLKRTEGNTKEASAPIRSFSVGDRSLKSPDEEGIVVEESAEPPAAKNCDIKRLIQERSTPTTSTPSSSLSSGSTLSIEHLELRNVTKKYLIIPKDAKDAIMKLPCAGPYMEILWENTIKQFNTHNGMHCILVDENGHRASLAGHLYLLFRMMFFFLSVALFDAVPRSKALQALYTDGSVYKIIDSPELFEFISSHPMVNTAKGFLRKPEYFKEYLKDNIMSMGGAKTMQKLQWMLHGGKLETLKVRTTFATCFIMIN
jgi:hypothetical protein